MSDSKGDKSPTNLRFGSGGKTTIESAKNLSSAIDRLVHYLKPYRSQLLKVAGLVLISTGAGLAGPILIGIAIDQYIMVKDWPGLARIALLMLCLFLIGGVSMIFQGMIMVKISQEVMVDIRGELFRHVQTLSMKYFDLHKTGDLMSRMTNDTEAINLVLSNGFIQFTTNILLLGGIVIAMFLLNWELALGTLTIIPIMLFITGKITRYSRKAFRDIQYNLGTLNTVMEENISGLRTVQAFVRGKKSIEKFKVVNRASWKAGIKAEIISAALGPIFTTMCTFTIAVTVFVGGWLTLREMATIGVVATFVVYIRNFFDPMRGMAMLYNQLQSALAGAERIFEILDIKSSVRDESEAQALPKIAGKVDFKQVSFEYLKDKPVLRNININIKPGETIALVGPTGAGKTTVISLLSRFYDVTEGAIFIDGKNIRLIKQSSLRQQLGIVLQDTFLFSGTVMENIRYGRLDATDQEVIESSKLANADRFIRMLPNGYADQVSEQGHNFSEGQRQLLAIARTILANPRILILDEATSSVDTRTEKQIQKALLHLLKGRTAFVIAHRLSTIRKADLVLVINDHQIIEQGTHDQLLAQKGFYYDLYMSQYDGG
jgi:ATP-binding cassette, subfamily B, multidrug efflux pump